MEPKTNTAPLPEVKPIKSPSGLDLRPAPKETVRLNRRAVMVFGFVVFSALVGYAYGGYRRQLNNQAEARDAAVPKNIVPATTAGKEFAKEQSNSSAAWTQLADSNHQLQSPGSVMGSQRLEGNCEARPQNSRVFKFDPQTGQPCAQRVGGLQTIVASQQTPLSRIQPAPASAPTGGTPSTQPKSKSDRTPDFPEDIPD